MNPLSNDELKAALRQMLPQLQSQFSVVKIGLYGPRTASGWAAHQFIPELLVECTQPLGLAFRELQRYIENGLGGPVRLHTLAMLDAQRRERVLAQVQYV